jgi:histidinol dehydrogenase
MPTFLDTAAPDFDARFTALLGQKREEAEDVDQAVAQIIADVRTRGDQAVIDLTARFDRLTLTPETLAFSKAEIATEIAKVTPEDRDLRGDFGL